MLITLNLDLVTLQNPNPTCGNSLLVVIEKNHRGKYVHPIHHQYEDDEIAILSLAVVWLLALAASKNPSFLSALPHPQWLWVDWFWSHDMTPPRQVLFQWFPDGLIWAQFCFLPSYFQKKFCFLLLQLSLQLVGLYFRLCESCSCGIIGQLINILDAYGLCLKDFCRVWIYAASYYIG